MTVDQASFVAVQPELLPGENILWAGQPSSTVLFRKEDMFLVPFSLFWGGFSIFWEAGVLGLFGSSNNNGKAWVFGALWGIPFVLMGQYMIWGRFVGAAWRKRRTFYAVTNRRVIAVQEGWKRKMASAYVDTLPTIVKEQGRKGLGTVRFTQALPFWTQRGGFGSWDGMAVGDVPEFRDIEDVDSVYRLVSQQRESQRQSLSR